MANDLEVDVVVVGVGLAGASAAIEASDGGAEVLAIERFNVGGSSAMSGGIIYAAGTEHQRASGFEDSAEGMFRYLESVVERPSVSPETLHRFCAESNANLMWLEEQGVPFAEGFWPYKTSNPPPGFGLYYSGSELCAPYRDASPPAPRGHKPVGDKSLPTAGLAGRANFTGYVTMWHLQDAMTARGIQIRTNTAVGGLVDDDGRVTGVQCSSDSDGPSVVRARRGVVLATGGFQADRDLVVRNNALFAALPPLGPASSDGEGIRLGQGVGGAVAFMNEFLASVSVPADALLYGIMIGPSGSRVTNERLYIGALGDEVIKAHNGRAWLVADDDIYAAAMAEAAEYGGEIDPNVAERLALDGHAVGDTVEALADGLGLSPSAVAYSVGRYNRQIARHQPDDLGKDDDFRRPIVRPPFHAFECSPRAFTSLGGLVVDEGSGRVVRPDGDPIEGLCAAGRTAVGVCGTARTYHSGLSLSDCVFSGRRAGRYLAHGLRSPGSGRGGP